MPKNEFGGSFELTFNREEDFKLFGREFARCYLNMSLKGKLEAPIIVGDRKYKVDFAVEGGCDTVIKNFKLAYNKTFHNNNVLQSAVHEDYVDQVKGMLKDNAHPDFTIELITCQVRPVLTDSEKIENALQFFNAPNQLLKDFDYQKIGQAGISDSDGLITFLLAKDKDLPANLKGLIDSTQQNLIDLLGVATSYVKKKGIENPDNQYDPALWQTVFNNLPLMGPSKFTEQTYSKRVKGVTLATDFLKLIMDSLVNPAGAALEQFGTFLTNVGKDIKAGIEKSSKTFKLGVICIVLESMERADSMILVPKLKAYFINFAQKDLHITTTCGSYDQFDIDFSYKENVAIFNYRSLEDPDTEKEFKDFLKKAQKDDIKNSSNFFNIGEI